jgi:hypothetical protein
VLKKGMLPMVRQAHHEAKPSMIRDLILSLSKDEAKGAFIAFLLESALSA